MKAAEYPNVPDYRRRAEYPSFFMDLFHGYWKVAYKIEFRIFIFLPEKVNFLKKYMMKFAGILAIVEPFQRQKLWRSVAYQPSALP